MDEGLEWVWFSGNERRKFSEDFRGNWRRIGRGNWAEMEASLRDAKVSLRHFLLHSLLSGIGRNAEEKEGMHRWGRSWKFWSLSGWVLSDCSLWIALSAHLPTELKDAGLYEEKLPARALKKFESNGVALQQRRRRGDRHSMPPDLVLRWRSRRAAVDRNDGGLNLNGWREICSSELAGRSCRKLS